MVISLADTCLHSIMDGVESGMIDDVHRFVPPKYRQRLLDMVLAHQKINNLIWIRELSSAEYLRGLTSFEIKNENGKETYVEYLAFSTQRGRKNDDEYLNKVADSLGSIWENVVTIGAGIMELKLNLYTNGTWEEEELQLNLGGLGRLIGQCTNLKSLDIRWKCVADNKSGMRLWGSALPILNRVESLKNCLPILENLDELSLAGQLGVRILVADHPIIEFKKLSSLRLIDCWVDDWRWEELLNSIRGTLTHLHLMDVDIVSSNGCTYEWLQSYLSIPLPFLKSLNIDGNFECGQSFVENLQQCTKLENVFLEPGYYGLYPTTMLANEKYLMALNRIDTQLEVKICISKTSLGGPEVLDANSHFKMVSIFNEKITHLDLNVHPWNRQTTVALENVVDVCCNLTTNLDLLDIYPNYHFGDEHLIRWAERGAKVLKLYISCFSVSDKGLIPVLVSSGNRLTTFIIWGSVKKITDRTWRVLIDHCPNVETVWPMPMHLWNLAKSKCYNIKLLEI